MATKKTIINRVIPNMEALLGSDYSQDSAYRYLWYPNGSFDCSSYAWFAFESAGFPLLDDEGNFLTYSSAQANVDDKYWECISGKHSDIGKKFFDASDYGIQTGDIILYCFNKNTSRSNKVTHIAIGYNSKEIIHTSNNREKACIKPITYGDGCVVAILRLRDVELPEKRTTRGMQMSLNVRGKNPRLKCDGVIGKLTTEAMQEIGAKNESQAWDIMYGDDVVVTPEYPDFDFKPIEPETPDNVTETLPDKVEENEEYYTIKSGDTLTKIADKYGVGVSQLCEWNDIGNPNKIYAGQVILVSKTATEYYTVKRGDNLTRIANENATSVSQLCEWNDIADANKIYEGQVLVVGR